MGLLDRLKELRSWLREEPKRAVPADASAVGSIAARVDLESRSDAELGELLDALPDGFADDDADLAGALAVLRELADRTLGLRPYPVQVEAAAAMVRLTSVELATGEGKTLVGALVAAVFALCGRRTHFLTANDYLAERDAAWMRPLYEAAGLSVAHITSAMTPDERRSAYRSDVVYIAVTEAGFDVLRDRIRTEVADLVVAGADVAIVDEADAVLLDEARVPLVLAADGRAVGTASSVTRLAASFEEGVDFEVDADRRTLHLTDAGLERVEAWRPGVDLFGRHSGLLAQINVALYAEALLTRDVDYVIEGDRVRLVSQARGRVEALQRWPEGLQAAVEAKEGLGSSAGVEILDQLLVRDLILSYPRFVGMSGTLLSDADELSELYATPVAALPPNRPLVRDDQADRLYETGAERDRAAVAEVAALHAAGRPVLVSTQSVAASEEFSTLLRDVGLDPVVLNAKNDTEEALIIARAGEPGRVTVSTQMAGRGTDIRLGDGSAEAGGLAVVGIGRFPTRRLDDQLRGRAGRQGDPGSSAFFVALDDDLIAQHEVPIPPFAADDTGLITEGKATGVPDQAQRFSDGEQRSLRAMSRRYGLGLAAQRRHLLDLRTERLTGGGAWESLRDHVGDAAERLEEEVPSAELEDAARLAVLTSLDDQWSRHLDFAASLREGIHLHSLAREDPVKAFGDRINQRYVGLAERAHTSAALILRRARVVDGHLDLSRAGIKRPGATWTYMTTDDHFGSLWERAGRALRRRLGGE